MNTQHELEDALHAAGAGCPANIPATSGEHWSNHEADAGSLSAWLAAHDAKVREDERERVRRKVDALWIYPHRCRPGEPEYSMVEREAVLALLDPTGTDPKEGANPLSNFGDSENDRMWWQQD
jgi:hypothetical protein